MRYARFPAHKEEYVLVHIPSRKCNQKDDEVPDDFNLAVPPGKR